MKLRFSILTLLLCAAVLLSAQPAPAQTKDNWVSVRSKNFFLIGNASEKDIRAVATKLEQFRETFRQIFPRVKFSQSIQTNVVVFKNASSYNPFRPKRADGKPDTNVAGYFQKGEDVNYITLSTEGEKEDTYGTIFHEYVHFLLDTNFGRSEVPPWFNEGLAEYYQTFQIKEDQKVILGNLQDSHLYLLQLSQLIPLKTFFEIDNFSLHQNGSHSRSIFYAQAWALIHYLTQANKGANAENMNKFLNLVMNKVEPEKAFQQIFQMDYAAMEKTLRKYVEQRTFTATVITLPKKLVFDAEMSVTPLSEAEANAYLGDLLYHTHEFEDAEKYLQRALALNADLSLANTSMGLVKMRQGRFDEAKKYLEKAVASDQKNHLAHYNYAYVLSRESQDEFGFVEKFPADKAARMREALHKAIAVKPDFAESYQLLSFISLVNNENLDEALKYLQTGLSLQPGNQEYAFLAAQIYMRQEKLKDAREIAEKLLKSAEDPSLRTNAQNLLNSINQLEESRANFEREVKESAGGKGVLIRKKSDKSLTEEEIARIERENKLIQLNQVISRPKAGEKQIVGSVQKISCERGVITYMVKTETETVSLTSKDFESLNLVSYLEEDDDTANVQVGCGSSLQNILMVLTYQETKDPKAKHKGNLVSIEFVPAYFKLKTAEELANAKTVVMVDDRPSEIPEEIKAEMEQSRRNAMLEGIKNALRQPQPDEKREMGHVEKIECSGKTITFFVNINSQTVKLKAKSPQDVKLAAFTPEAEQLQFGCGAKFPPISTIITYRANGDLVALEFVPKSFKL